MSSAPEAIVIRRLAAGEAEDAAPGLAHVLVDCVAGGASVGFMSPFPLRDAEAYWRDVARAVASGDVALLIAEAAGEIAGTVQLHPSWKPNQTHRADVARLLVARHFRRRGLGIGLMRAVEEEALALARWLLCLDTATGSEAEALYERLGWTRAGVIPDYARWPDGRLCATTLFWKRLAR